MSNFLILLWIQRLREFPIHRQWSLYTMDVPNRFQHPFIALSGIFAAYRAYLHSYLIDEDNNGLPIRYRELQLLTDMMSGMTDGFAIELYNDLKRFNVGASANG